MSKAPLMRVFYVVYPDEPELCAWLNLLRALANPHEKEPAHVTVRGPYRQRYRLPQQAQGVRGTTVHVPGADAFLSERQSTVILRCQAEQLRALWRKPDYPGFTPHLTVCDGLPRALSEEILDITRSIPPFSFRVGELQPIFSKPKQTTLGLLSAIDRTLLAEIAGERLHAEALLRMATPERLRLLRRAVAHGTQGGVLHAAHPPRSTPRPPDPQKAERESP